MNLRVPRKRTLGRHFLVRGESLIATTGLILAAILLAVLAATAYWTLRVQRTALESARAEEIRSLGEVLSETSGLMFSVGEVSAARRLVIDVGRICNLTECRIVLSDGRILADADPSRITEANLPESWANEAISGGIDLTVPGVVKLSHPVEIRGRGHARLEISAPVRYPLLGYWEAQLGVAAIGSGALLALLLIYRRLRARFLGIGLIRDALLALGRGDETPYDGALHEDFGPEARAWNQLLAERERFQKEAMSTRVMATLAAHPAENRQLQEICDAMRQGVIIIDKSLHVTYGNGAAAVYLGLPPDDLNGAPLADLLADLEAATSLKAVVAAGVRSSTCVEIDRHGKEANSVLRFSVRPLRRTDSAAAMITIEDLTQQRVAEEARSAFITKVAHELRAPLTNIRLSAEMVIEDGEKTPQIRARCLNVINQEAQRLERVVNDMLTVAQIEAGTLDLRRDDVRLDKLFERLESDCAAQAAEKSITLEFNLPPKLPLLNADREKITLALYNLVNNAMKYTPEGGRVTVSADVTEGQVVVDVVDTGIGIAESDVDRIFEKFYRAQDERIADITGSGLGLTLTQEVVRMHGGDVRVKSEPNKGSTFTVLLPITAQAA